MLTYDFRLPPGPRTVEYALLAEALGFRAVWCPEIPAFGHDIWVTLARIAAMDYMLKRWPAFTRFLDDGRICLSNNAAGTAADAAP